ncbi:MAG: hypothetical protein MUF15_03720 [Acidobacteria bacterium]|jgi:hypothetical protein|nr:hypothetical protein [Acidobacteriota bacterium]
MENQHANNLTIRREVENGNTFVIVSDGTDEVRFTRYRQGVFYCGAKKAVDTIATNQSFLFGLGLTESVLRVITAVSENEGALDAVNTWDNAFLSFGMFQWTMGSGTEPGELAALLAKIKNTAPDVFKTYYGNYGLDIELHNTLTGYLVLDGKRMATPADKGPFRSETWAFYFWKSGLNPIVQSLQVLHAAQRVGTFYRSENYKPNGFYISDLITSEYGTALVLDQHVNRPGYVTPSLTQAMNQAGLTNPRTWGKAEESRLLTEYIKVRATYGTNPMTDANKRAQTIGNYLRNGTISDERSSFR